MKSWSLGLNFLNFLVHIFGNVTTSYFQSETFWPLITTVLFWGRLYLDMQILINPLSPHGPHLISTPSPWSSLNWITLMSSTQGESFISLFGYLNSIKRGCGSMGVTGTSPLPISHPDALLCLGWLSFSFDKIWDVANEEAEAARDRHDPLIGVESRGCDALVVNIRGCQSCK